MTITNSLPTLRRVKLTVALYDISCPFLDRYGLSSHRVNCQPLVQEVRTQPEVQTGNVLDLHDLLARFGSSGLEVCSFHMIPQW